MEAATQIAPKRITLKRLLAVLGLGLLILAIGAVGSQVIANQKGDEKTAAAPTSDRNQEIADQVAAMAPDGLAQICKGMQLIGPEATAKMGRNQLGGTIIQLGGEVGPTVDALLAKC